MSDNNVNPPNKPDFFDVFKKLAGDKNDSNVTKVGIKFGQFLGEIKGTGGKNTGGNTPDNLVNGQHSYANTVRKAYATQGKSIPNNVTKLLSNLNNIAMHGQQAKSMDTKVRLQMIAGGTSSLDFNVIREQENEVLTQLQAATNNVVLAEERLDFRKKTAQTSKAETDASIALINQISANDELQLSRNKQATNAFLDSLTYEELIPLARGTTPLPEGITPFAVGQRFREIRDSRNATEKAALNLATTRLDFQSKVLATTMTSDMLTEMEAVASESFNSDPNSLGRVQIPGTDQFATFAQIQEARINRQKFDAENKPASSALALGHLAEGINLANQAAQAVDEGIIPENSAEFNRLNEQVSTLLELTTPAEIKQQLKEVESTHKDLLTKQAELQPTAETKIAFRSQFENGGMPTEIAAAALASRNPVAKEQALNGNPLTREGNALMNAIVAFNSENTDDNDVSLVNGLATLSGKAASTDKLVNDYLRTALDPEVQNVVASYVGTQLAEEALVHVTHNSLDQMLNTVIEDTKNGAYTPEQSGAITGAITTFMETLFGNDLENPTVFSNTNGNTALIGLEPLIKITHEDGEEVEEAYTDINGDPLTGKKIHLDVYATQLSTLDVLLKDSGYIGDSIAQQVMSNDGARASEIIANRNNFNNQQQREFAYSTLGLFQENIGTDPKVLLGRVTQNVYQQLRRQMNFDREKAEANNVESLLEEAVDLDKNIFQNAVSEYIEDVFSKAHASGLSTDEANHRSFAARESITTEQLFRLGYITRSQIFNAVAVTE